MNPRNLRLPTVLLMGALILGGCGDPSPTQPAAGSPESGSLGAPSVPGDRGGVSGATSYRRPEHLAPAITNLNQCRMVSYVEDDESATWGWKRGSAVLEPEAGSVHGAGPEDVARVWYLRFDPESERKVVFEAQCIVPAALASARRAASQLGRFGPRTGRRPGTTGDVFAAWGDPEVACTWYSNWDIVECEGGSECVRAYFAPPMGPGAPALPEETAGVEYDGGGGVYGTWECDPPPCTLYVSLVSQDYECDGEEEGGDGEVCFEFEPGECEGSGGGGGGGGGEEEPQSECDPGLDPNCPCLGNPIKNPQIAAQTNSGVAGGRFGMARDGGTTMHWGLDVQNSTGDAVYSMFAGTVINTGVNSSWGNWVMIRSTVNGKTVDVLYAHTEAADITGTVEAGTVIGSSNISGNLVTAIRDGYAVPHLHIEIVEVSGSLSWNQRRHTALQLNPEDFFATKFQSNGDPVSGTSC